MTSTQTRHEQLKHLERRRNVANAVYSLLYLIGIAIFIAIAVKSFQAYQAGDILSQFAGGLSMVGAMLCLLIVANFQAKTSVAHHGKIMALRSKIGTD